MGLKRRITDTPLGVAGTGASAWRTSVPVQPGVAVRGYAMARTLAFHNGTVRPKGIPGGVPG